MKVESGHGPTGHSEQSFAASAVMTAVGITVCEVVLTDPILQLHRVPCACSCLQAFCPEQHVVEATASVHVALEDDDCYVARLPVSLSRRVITGNYSYATVSCRVPSARSRAEAITVSGMDSSVVNCLMCRPAVKYVVCCLCQTSLAGLRHRRWKP